MLNSHDSTKYTQFYLLIWYNGLTFSISIWNWGMYEEKMSEVYKASDSSMDYQGPAAANLPTTSKKWLKKNINTSKISARSSLD